MKSDPKTVARDIKTKPSRPVAGAVLSFKAFDKHGRPLSTHPWFYQRSLAAAESAADGDLLPVTDAAGQFVGWGLYSSQSSINLRLVSRNPEFKPVGRWWRPALESAMERRRRLPTGSGVAADYHRLVFSEADALPGLVADRFGEWLSVQIHVPGIERVADQIAADLLETTGCRGIRETSDADARAREGLPPANRVWGETPPAEIIANFGELKFMLDLAGGQKTGFYLDQTENRRIFAAAVSAGARVLDVFANSGSFAIAAMRADAAAATLVESSAPALELAAKNWHLNGLAESNLTTLRADAFAAMRELRDRAASFDAIVLDPPKLAPTRAALAKAARAYKDINLLAMKLLAPGGILATFSCSQAVSRSDFLEILQRAARDSGRAIRVLQHLQQPPDHPILLGFPESEYLKGYLLTAD